MDIPKFYADRCIFVTGVTGFMGKVLLEKILRCCPDVSKIYVLIRSKKGEAPHDRLKDLLQAPLFEATLKRRPDCISHIFPVDGDTLRPNFGIRAADLNSIMENVSIVFHCAASVRFQEPLKDALDSNVRSVEIMLQLIKQMQKFEALVHLSTAYAYCYRKHIDEVIYPAAINASDLLNCSGWMSRDMLDKLAPDLQGDHPNPYTYTKSLAENFLYHYAPKNRTVIIRPSIVTATWQEPMPGWCDSINGPVGLVITFGKGLLRTMLGKRTTVANFVPVDVAINLMLASAWRIAKRRHGASIAVYNCTNCETNRIHWGELSDYLTASARAMPLDTPVRIPPYGSSISPNNIKHKIEWIVCHWIPAYIADAILRLACKNPRFVKLYKKIHSMSDSLNYFTMRSWTWNNDNVKELLNSMSKEDREMFYLDTSTLNWKTYIADYHAGVKKYILKEKMKDVPRTKKWIKYRQHLSSFLEAVLMLSICYALVSNGFVSSTKVAVALLIVFIYVTCRYLLKMSRSKSEKYA